MSTTDPGHNALTRYIYTYTGRRVDEPGGEGSPSVLDIAVQTGRIPRFVGATTVWWPVLLHLFVVREIVMDWGGGPGLQLEALFHDAHECLTGDVPAPFKPEAISHFQATLDLRMRADLGVPVPREGEKDIIKTADREALLAEGHVLGPQGDKEWIEAAGGPDPRAEECVLVVMDWYPQPEDTIYESGAAVCDFVLLFNSLLKQVNGDQ